jgi:hypothetical protein
MMALQFNMGKNAIEQYSRAALTRGPSYREDVRVIGEPTGWYRTMRKGLRRFRDSKDRLNFLLAVHYLPLYT